MKPDDLKSLVRKAAAQRQLRAPFVDPEVATKGTPTDWPLMILHQNKTSQLMAVVMEINGEVAAVVMIGESLQRLCLDLIKEHDGRMWLFDLSGQDLFITW
jgi:hypothetical protein